MRNEWAKGGPPAPYNQGCSFLDLSGDELAFPGCPLRQWASQLWIKDADPIDFRRPARRDLGWSHGGLELLLCEVVCLGVRDGASETLLTEVKGIPEITDLGKLSFGDDTAHIDDWCVFIILYVSLAFLSPLRGDLSIDLHVLIKCDPPLQSAI